MELYKRVISIADSMGLGHWTIRVEEHKDSELIDEDDPDADTTFAKCWPAPGYATIAFYKPFYEALPEAQLTTILHELLHCVFYSVDEVIIGLPNIVEGLLELIQRIAPEDKEARAGVLEFFFEEVKRNYDERAELMVEQLASVIRSIAEGGLKE